MSEESGDSVPNPGFLLPGIRTAVEMALVATIIGLFGLPTEDTFVLAVVLLAALVGMVVVLFWAMNRHMRRWIRYAQGKPTRLTIFD
jgi:ABC-type multidrug transport system fused ATPase/permease subunit